MDIKVTQIQKVVFDTTFVMTMNGDEYGDIKKALKMVTNNKVLTPDEERHKTRCKKMLNDM